MTENEAIEVEGLVQEYNGLRDELDAEKARGVKIESERDNYKGSLEVVSEGYKRLQEEQSKFIKERAELLSTIEGIKISVESIFDSSYEVDLYLKRIRSYIT
jgi:hypothetical protein